MAGFDISTLKKGKAEEIRPEVHNRETDFPRGTLDQQSVSSFWSLASSSHSWTLTLSEGIYKTTAMLEVPEAILDVCGGR